MLLKGNLHVILHYITLLLMPLLICAGIIKSCDNFLPVVKTSFLTQAHCPERAKLKNDTYEATVLIKQDGCESSPAKTIHARVVLYKI